MSDVTTGTAFNPQFFVNPPWWIGRVESKTTWDENVQAETFEGLNAIKGWGHRYNVRVFNWHTGDVDKLKPEETVKAQVVMPVTAGSGHGGASITPSIESGSVVFGFFKDGMAGQEPYIVGVIGNSNNNVPKKRAEPAPNQPVATPSPTGGTPTVSKPPTPVRGPGSLANKPVPPNVDQLSIDQLKKLLDPSKTPSSAVFKAASEARQKAKAEGKDAKEIERLVLAATVKASRQPGASASSGNCNKGYQQFNDTYTEGSPQTAAKVPDDRILNGSPLSTTEAQHVEVQSKTEQDKDSKIKVPLLDVSKQGNSKMKGIQRTMKNLLNVVEELKRIYNQASSFATGVLEFTEKIKSTVSNAAFEMAGFAKGMLNGVRGYISKKISDGVKSVVPYLFPTEVPQLLEISQKGCDKLSCVMNKIIKGLQGTFTGLLENVLDRFINAPLCAAESIMGDFIDTILDPLMSTLDGIFTPINALLGTITGGLAGGIGSLVGGLVGGGLGKVAGNLFNALDYVPGILQFFSCEDTQAAVKYQEISQDRSALPGGDAAPTPTGDNQSATGKGANTANPVMSNIVSNTTFNGDYQVSGASTDAFTGQVSSLVETAKEYEIYVGSESNTSGIGQLRTSAKNNPEDLQKFATYVDNQVKNETPKLRDEINSGKKDSDPDPSFTLY
jgi:hypothetical protein